MQGLEGLINAYTLREVASVPVICHLESSLCVLGVRFAGPCLLHRPPSDRVQAVFGPLYEAGTGGVKDFEVGLHRFSSRCCPTDKRGYLWKLIITRK